MRTVDCDYLVIGSGLAGLMSAWYLKDHGQVVLATKREMLDSNSDRAQGGIACAIAENDSVDAHTADTLSTGGGLSDEGVVRSILASGPRHIRDLEGMGILFSKRSDHEEEYDLGREGGHSVRRVLHAGDITGHEVIKVLADRVTAHPNVKLRPNLMAIDLVTTGWLKVKGPNQCIGSYFLNRVNGEILAIRARHTVLATGGAGKVYLYTSNPDIATGDGIAMAWRAGLAIRNMEFVQFHPTCLYHPDAKSFLISEAVRGEGGVLINAAGQSFMEKYDSRGSLAPRDVVARAIDHEMKTRGDTCVYLDVRRHDEEFLRSRFPNLYRVCLKYGFDMAREPVPVVPAAHYLCGGVCTDQSGVTELAGLYAVGEVACTGLHGANRLASNSLLEALVCAGNAVESMLRQAEHNPGDSVIPIPDWQSGDAVNSDEAVVVEHNWNEVRTCMWDYVGIVRTNKRLERALRRINNLRCEIRQYYLDYLITPDVLELRNIAAVAELIARSAMMRRESRGLHYTLDYPHTDDAHFRHDTIIQDPPGGPVMDAV
ncbi:MAG: L-aspartate oxidase [Spartobacteria bacterium]|nr:L-aspartate oxidase [Spartobacteria bacterium]